MAGAKSTGPRERQENRRWAEDHLATPSLAQGGQLQDGGLVAGAGGQGKKQDDEQEKQVEEQVEEQVDHSWQVLLLGRDPLILPHPHFHLAGLGLPLTGWQWEKSVRSLLLCLKPQHLCRVDKDKVQPTTSSSSSPAFPHNAAAAQCLANMDFSEAAASFTNSFTRNITHNLRRWRT